ncbi:hypothetical protein PAXINDRAFT_168822 [Paxillus involutus ATCC 200175]|uniref:Uncharacterized protein n=1 Tax=Paxillus involutus ATCC 200175 TaxID=664439 RepID=A0A0C9UA09_PAXIN|nr:hypothetical protein PAXINDRAFT_168822 [Paxillus involutus ATCC 200175]
MQLSRLALLVAFVCSAVALPVAPAAELLDRSPVQDRSTGVTPEMKRGSGGIASPGWKRGSGDIDSPEWKRGSGGISSPGWRRETTDFDVPA